MAQHHCAAGARFVYVMIHRSREGKEGREGVAKGAKALGRTNSLTICRLAKVDARKGASLLELLRHSSI